MDQNTNDQSDQSQLEEQICSICLETMDSQTSLTLEECTHTFHSTCIVKWFRSQHSSCPQCRGEPNHMMSFMDATLRLKELIRISKTKQAPVKLKQAIQKLEQTRHTINQSRTKRKLIGQEATELKKHPKVQQYLDKLNKSQGRVALQSMKKETEQLAQLEYAIGATDYGVPVRNITSTPILAITLPSGTFLI